MKTWKHRCGIQVGASEPGAYRLVLKVFTRKHTGWIAGAISWITHSMKIDNLFICCSIPQCFSVHTFSWVCHQLPQQLSAARYEEFVTTVWQHTDKRFEPHFTQSSAPTIIYYFTELQSPSSCSQSAVTWGVSNKVDIARFWLQSTMICYNFSFDGYLHLRWLQNYSGRVHVSLFLVQVLSKNGSNENK